MAPARIDTHQHIVPPAYAAWLKRLGAAAGGLPIPDWSREAALAMMDEHAVRTGILSVSTPGVHFGDDDEARRWARDVNEYAAEVARDLPGRFGFFASLCLPDVDGSLAELAYAFDTLRADGVILLANCRGSYLGDEKFAPVFDELNRRKAVVFVHPSQPPGLESLPGLPTFIADFLLDTTRAAVRLCASGTLDRCPDLRVILSHAGGFVPYAASRLALAASPKGNPVDGLAQLQKFYFDIALSGSPTALPSLLAFAKPGHVTFGSDFPHAPDFVVKSFTSMYERYAIDDAQRASIDRGAAEQLFPRLRTQEA
jgi:predicted TIM-barrel fold metal-dependent hydrolase